MLLKGTDNRTLNGLSEVMSKAVSVRRICIKGLRCLLSINKNDTYPKDSKNAM